MTWDWLDAFIGGFAGSLLGIAGSLFVAWVNHRLALRRQASQNARSTRLEVRKLIADWEKELDAIWRTLQTANALGSGHSGQAKRDAAKAALQEQQQNCERIANEAVRLAPTNRHLQEAKAKRIISKIDSRPPVVVADSQKNITIVRGLLDKARDELS